MSDNIKHEKVQQAIWFLKTIWLGGILSGMLEVFNKGNTKSQFFTYDEIPQMVEYSLTEAESADVFYRVCAVDTEKITTGRGSSECVSAVPALWLDLDYSGEGHVSQNYPPPNEVLAILDEFPLKPSIVVHSGHGYHVYLLLDKPLIIDSEESRRKAQALSKRFQNYFILKAKEKSLVFDDTSDLARLLRLPSTLNRKGNEPLPVNITDIGDSSRRYSIDEILEVVGNTPPKLHGMKKGGKNYPALDEEKPVIKPPREPIYADIVEKLQNSPYFLDEHGYLCSLDKDEEPVRQANFVLIPKSEIVTTDGYTEKREFVFYAIATGGELLPEVTIQAAKFDKIDWIYDIWGLKASLMPVYNAKNIVRCVAQYLAKDIPVETRYSHIGWRKINDEYGYIHARGCVGQEGVSVVMEEFLKGYILPKNVDDMTAAVRTSLSLLDLAPKNVTIPLLSLMFLAPLVEPLYQVGITPSFILWLVGSSGSRKTTLANLFLSHFRTYTNIPPASFKDTANSIERKAHLTKDSVLLVDDYHPSSNAAEREHMQRTANHILRMYGDRVSRGRLNADCSTKADYPPRGLAIITGEETIGGLSAAARCINVELPKGSVDLDKLTEAQQTPDLLSQCMLGYIQYLAPLMELLPGKLQNEFIKQREELRNSDRHGRIDASIIHLKMAFKIFINFALAVKVISQEEADSFMDESKSVYDTLIQRAEEELENERPEQMFLKVLTSMLAAGEYYLDMSHSQLSVKDLYPRGKKIGWKEGDFYYLIPEAVYSAVNRELRSLDMSLPVKQATLFKQLAASNIIKTETEISKGFTRERNTIKKSICGERRRVIALYKDKLDL